MEIVISMNTITKQCNKCNKIWEVKKTSDHSRKQHTHYDFCRSCNNSATNRGISLLDEVLMKQYPYYNPAGPYTLICPCGTEQTYTTKYSLIRVLETTGKCGKCTKAMKRKGWTLSKQNANTRRLNAYNYAYGTNYTDVKDIPVDNIEQRRYNTQVAAMSKTNLKREKPELYKKYMANKWDGTDTSQLTIEHIKPKSECFHEGISPVDCAHIDNLEVITMQENWDNYKKLLDK